jgi:hypothetical protein
VTRKPTNASGYEPQFTRAVQRTCLYVATKIGDLRDDTVVVGGLVPTLIVEQRSDLGLEAVHVGTLDLDLGFRSEVLSEGRYHELAGRLRTAGFEPDRNDSGQLTRQRWKIDGPPTVTVDFLVPPTMEGDAGGSIRNIEHDFAAIIAPGLKLAFIDNRLVKLDDTTIRKEQAARDVLVAGPAAFVAMKALAFRLRGENKDAYDLWYVLRYFGAGLEEVVHHAGEMRHEPEFIEALGFLAEDFASMSSLGPMRVAEFLGRTSDESFLADASGLVLAFVRECRSLP